jgi:hypothetical protein
MQQLQVFQIGLLHALWRELDEYFALPVGNDQLLGSQFENKRTSEIK